MESVIDRVLHSARAAGGVITMSLVRRELGAGGAATPASVPAIADKAFLDAEKVVMDWVDLDGRVIEEAR